ncbi:MAG TPA: OPT family oligopeptide transporter [Burkholderiaceae bacterium]|nr:OPT family oligopeptide transporter [Burkholderiaceae bacterium]
MSALTRTGKAKFAIRSPQSGNGPPAAEVVAPAAHASLEEKDRHWFSTVYQGDRVPQLTVRAVLTGAVIGMLMSVGNLYTNLKVGFSVGIVITACVLSYLGWGMLRAASGRRLGQLSILENNCMQSTASAAGFSTGSLVSVTFAALMILDPQHRHQPWWVVAAFTFTTAAMGVFLAIPLKRHLINDAQLPFPTGTAAAATLRSLYGSGREALQKAHALLIALAVGAISGVLSTAEEQFAALGRFFAWMRAHLFDLHLPGQLPAQGFGLIDGKPVLGFGFEPGVMVIGLGMIVGLRVSLSMLAASAALYFFIAPWLHSIDAAHAGVTGYVASIAAIRGGAIYHPLRWALWGGASVLVFANLTALALQWRTIGRAFAMLRAPRARNVANEPPSALQQAMNAIEVPVIWMIAGMAPLTIAMVAIQVVAFGVAWWAGLIAVTLCFVLSLVVSRSAGETDLSPVGAMGKLMQMLFALMSPPSAVGAPASITQNVMSAGISANSASASADLLSDLKTGYLLGANPRQQFLAQLAGVFFGTLACVPAWYLMVPNFAALEAYPNPAAQTWVAVARALTGGLSTLPPSVLYAVLMGAAIGVLLPLVAKAFPKARPALPSATGLGLGWMVPFSIPLSFAIGAAIGAIWRRLSPASEDTYSVPVASGLIAGESMIKALLAMLATAVGLAA